MKLIFLQYSELVQNLDFRVRFVYMCCKCGLILMCVRDQTAFIS